MDYKDKITKEELDRLIIGLSREEDLFQLFTKLDLSKLDNNAISLIKAQKQVIDMLKDKALKLNEQLIESLEFNDRMSHRILQDRSISNGSFNNN